MRSTVLVIAFSAMSVLACGGDPPTGNGTPTVASVVVSPGAATLVSFGETVTLSATARNSSGGAISGKSFSWSSSDGNVATVNSSGEVTAVGNGTATITATADGVSGTASVEVDQVVASIAVTPNNSTVSAYGTLGGVQLSAVALDALGNAVADVVSFTWSSADVQIARVDDTGAVVTLAEGSVSITASAEGVDGSTTVVSSPPPVPSTDLVAHYPFTDGAVDRSGNGHDGTPSGASLTLDRFGNSNGAYDFDGVDDFIELAGSFGHMTVPFSVSAWVLQRQSPAAGAVITLHDPPNPVGNYYGFWLNRQVNVVISYGNGGFPAPGSRRTGTSLVPPSFDIWTHVAATVRGPTDMTVYIDGKPSCCNFSGTGGAMAHNGWPARIGRNAQNTPTQYWYGLIDDLRLYTGSLTDAEVMQLYREGGWQ